MPDGERAAPALRADDAHLLALADHLAPGLAVRLRDLIQAPEGAAAYIEQRDKAQRADDLSRECRRQLLSLSRQVDRLRSEEARRTHPSDGRATRGLGTDPLRERVESVLASDDHTPECDHWRGDGACSCLRPRLRAALGSIPPGPG